LALAQITVTETHTGSANFINIAECDNTTPDGLTFTWTFPAFVAGGTYTLTASDTDGCPVPTSNGQQVNNQTLGSGIAANSATGTFPVSGSQSVPGLLGNLKIPCNSSKTPIFFCVTLTSAPGTPPPMATGTIALDLLRPPAATPTRVESADSALIVNWTFGATGGGDAGSSGSADRFRIEARVRGNVNAPVIRSDEITPGSSTRGRIGGLQNNVEYDVIVVAISQGGNESENGFVAGNAAPDGAIQGTPVEVDDFWRIYKADGGREGGGCAAGAAGMLALLAVPMALRAWRRRS
jgi:hypothetical protein